LLLFYLTLQTKKWTTKVFITKENEKHIFSKSDKKQFTKMKTIGLIGGLSWESTALYYQIFNRKVQDILGDTHSCKSLIYSVDFAEIAELQHKNDWETLAEKMVEAAQNLEKGGADFILIGANTMHKVVDIIQKNINIPILHIVDPTAIEIQKRNIKKVGLLATKFTMEGDFIKNRFYEQFDIETIIPNETERIEIHKVIYEELVKGICNPKSKTLFLEIMSNLIAQGAEAIVLGCTEIELLIKKSETNIEIFETARLHAESAVNMALTQ
jgi:aspartate racemase